MSGIINMRITLALIAAALLFGCQTMQSSDATRGEIVAVTQAWIDAMSSHDAQKVVGLYDSEAVLWGTRSPTLRDTPATVRDYFKLLSTVPPSYKVVLGEQRIRGYGDIVVNTGTYTFSEIRDGKEILRPARFSFVYRNRNGRWLIVDHHSSVVPEAPKP